MPFCFVCYENFKIQLHLYVNLNIFHDVGNIKEFHVKKCIVLGTLVT